MAKPWDNYKARKVKARDDAVRQVQANRPRQDRLPVPGPYPEHAKMYPHTQTNWEIREFWHFLAAQGLSPLDWDEMNDQLLIWRGVDKDRYLQEAQDMREKYQWLWGQFEPRLPELASVIDETKPPARTVANPPGTVSLADYFRKGLSTCPTYEALRMKLSRSRRTHPDIVPVGRSLGGWQLYTAEELKAWEQEYDRRSGRAKSGGVRRVAQAEDKAKVEVADVPVVDAAQMLLSKLRGEAD